MVADIASVIGTAITTAGSIYQMAKNNNSSELMLKISDLNMILAQAQNQIAELLAENLRLNELLAQEKENPLTFNKASGFYTDQEGSNYCPACYDKTKLRSRLRNNYNLIEPLFCPVCKQAYSEKS